MEGVQIRRWDKKRGYKIVLRVNRSRTELWLKFHGFICIEDGFSSPYYSHPDWKMSELDKDKLLYRQAKGLEDRHRISRLRQYCHQEEQLKFHTNHLKRVASFTGSGEMHEVFD